MGGVCYPALSAGHPGHKDKEKDLFSVFLCGFFFSCITPSAGGGQPAQVYYMRKNMIPVPVATVVLMVVTITYKSVLVVIGCLLAVFGQGFLNRYLYEVMPVYYLGLGLNVVFCAAMLVLAFHTSLARDMAMRVLGLLEHFRFLKKKPPGQSACSLPWSIIMIRLPSCASTSMCCSECCFSPSASGWHCFQ